MFWLWRLSKYDPDQPRDESGRWTDTGRSFSEAGATPTMPLGRFTDLRTSFAAYSGKGMLAEPEAVPFARREVLRAGSWVKEMGRQHGYEFLVALDLNNGDTLTAHTSGSPTNVEFGATLAPLLNDPSRSIACVHNHPTGRSLSTQDLAVLSFAGVTRITAIAHAGFFHTAERGPNWDAFISTHGGLETGMARVGAGVEWVLDKIVQTPDENAKGILREGSLKRSDANRYYHTAVNEVLHRLGVIKLSTSDIKETDAGRVFASDEIEARIGPAVRSAVRDMETYRSSVAAKSESESEIIDPPTPYDEPAVIHAFIIRMQPYAARPAVAAAIAQAKSYLRA